MINMDTETHKEIVEIKRDIRELRAGQDAEFHHNRGKYEKLLDDAVNRDSEIVQILLEVDGFQSAKDIEKKLNVPQKRCWRKLDRLLSKNIIFQTEESKKGSPIYQQSRWFKQLRLDDYLKRQHSKLISKEDQQEEQNESPNTSTDQNQSV